MKRLATLSALTLMALLAAFPALAQNYSFAIPRAVMEVWVNPDASVRIEYNLTFRCNPGAHPIDVVDVGMPTGDYELDKVKAALDGKPQTDIRHSEYVHPGVEVHLSPSISAGEEAMLTVEFTIPNLVFQDTTNKENASFRITPTWYDAKFLTGTTELGVLVYLPKDINPDEVLYQGQKVFTTKGQIGNKTVVGWLFSQARLDAAHLVGLSFPKRVMERVVRMTLLGLAWKWWTENSQTRAIVGVLLLLATGIFFFRWTGCTGCVVFGFIVVVLGIAFSASPAIEALYPLLLIPLWIWMEKTRKLHRRRYLPAIASLPGGGIKRGLTPAEAAVILELPLSKVLTLILFGMLKKGLLRQEQADPLQVSVTEQAASLLKAGAPEPPDSTSEVPAEVPPPVDSETGGPSLEEAGAPILRSYEPAFLQALAQQADKAVVDMELDEPMKKLVLATAKKMAGFDLEQTREYYRSIISKAWEQAQTLGDLEKRTEFVDDNLEVLLLYPHYGPRFRQWDDEGFTYQPSWSRSVGSGAMPTAATARTSFGDVAASFAGWSENLAGRFASAIDPVKVGLSTPGGVSLAGVDRVTGDVLKAMASSSGSSGGGGGGGCACACAGCACACACAGGGR